MAKDENKERAECFGDYNAEDWECSPDECADSKDCKAATGKKAPPKAKAKAKPTKEQKTKAVKKVAKAPADDAVHKAAKAKAKAKAKSAPKIKAEKPKKVKKEKPAKKAEIVVVEEKPLTKEVIAKTDTYAEKILALKVKAANAAATLILKGGAMMKKAQELLPVDAFKEWCEEKIGYERTMVLRFIQGYELFSEKPELIKDLGVTKILAVLPHPEPVKFLEEHKDEVMEKPYREVREIIAEDKKEITGEEPKKKETNPVLDLVRALKSMTGGMQKNFMIVSKLAGRKKLKLDAAEQEALQLHLEELTEWQEKLQAILDKAKSEE
jgi:hypothetical protein